MKILIISDIPTAPINAGNRKIIRTYTDLFRSWGNEVHFLFVNKFSLRKKYRLQIKDAIPETRKEWGNFYHQYNCSLWENIYTNSNIITDKIFRKGYRKCDDVYPNGLDDEVRKLHGIYHFDALLVNYFYLSKALDAIPIRRKALFTHDAFSMHEKSDKYKAVYYLKREDEQKALSRATYIFAMQDVEAEYFKQLMPNRVILKNYSNCKYCIQPIVGNHNILYIAANTDLNIDGIKWFIKNILPIIKEKYDDVKLLIAGNICDALAEYAKIPEIELMGFVDDFASFYRQGDIAINPCRFGTGLKIKTFEAVSYDKITLSHPNGLIGIFKEKESPVFSSEKALDWLDFITKVWESHSFITEIKERNRRYIQQMNDYIIGQYKIWLNGKENET